MASDLAFERLFEEDDLPRFDLPEEIERISGPFGLTERVVFGNFVTSVDGVVDLEGIPAASRLISQGHPADRFVMALLRASADAVVVGAGTFRAHPGPWTAARAFPDLADAFAELRSRLHAAAGPRLVVVSASGELGEDEEKLRDALVVTTSDAGSAIAGGAEVVELAEGDPIDASKIVPLLAERGYHRILTEGGPHLMGQLIDAGVVDELFLTVSPLIAGGGEGRSTFAAGVQILPQALQPARLLSLRRSGSYLFARYALGTRRALDR